MDHQRTVGEGTTERRSRGPDGPGSGHGRGVEEDSSQERKVKWGVLFEDPTEPLVRPGGSFSFVHSLTFFMRPPPPFGSRQLVLCVDGVFSCPRALGEAELPSLHDLRL